MLIVGLIALAGALGVLTYVSVRHTELGLLVHVWWLNTTRPIRYSTLRRR